MKLTKHVGKLKELDQKVYVVWMQLPNEPSKALVVAPHTLPDMIGDELRGLIESDECQAETDLSVFLNRKTMTSISGGSILNWLHMNKKLIPVPVSSVIMIPHPSQPTPLAELLTMMGISQQNSGPVGELAKSRETLPLIKAETVDERRSIAQNLLLEANLLREEASKKEKQASALVPGLVLPTAEVASTKKIKALEVSETVEVKTVE